MTGQLRHELHGMVDDAVGTDLVDRALGTARAMRRRRAAGGTVAAVAVVAALATPFALTAGHRPARPVAGVVTPPPVCTPPSGPTANLDAISRTVLGHFPGGGLTPTKTFVTCRAGISEDTELSFAGANGQDRLWVHLVSRADNTPGLPYREGTAFTATDCKGLLDPQPSDSPLSFSPSTVADPWDGATPSSSPPFSPSDPPDAPTPNPWVGATPHLLSCVDGTASAPMVFEVSFGSVLAAGAVYPDHRGVFAWAVPATSSPAGPALDIDQLAAIATDAGLPAMVPVR